MKNIAVAALLTLGCAAAHAETGWIVIEGFYDGRLGIDRPDYKLFGMFEGTDADHDGVLRSDELSYLEIGNLTYVAPTPEYPYTCDESYHYCGASIEYTIGSGTARISAYETWTDPEHIHYSRYNFETGSRYTGDHSGNLYYDLRWTSYTTMTVSAVPEPTTAGMLLLGLAGTAAFARRRRS